MYSEQINIIKMPEHKEFKNTFVYKVFRSKEWSKNLYLGGEHTSTKSKYCKELKIMEDQ